MSDNKEKQVDQAPKAEAPKAEAVKKNKTVKVVILSAISYLGVNKFPSVDKDGKPVVVEIPADVAKTFGKKYVKTV